MLPIRQFDSCWLFSDCTHYTSKQRGSSYILMSLNVQWHISEQTHMFVSSKAWMRPAWRVLRVHCGSLSSGLHCICMSLGLRLSVIQGRWLYTFSEGSTILLWVIQSPKLCDKSYTVLLMLLLLLSLLLIILVWYWFWRTCKLLLTYRILQCFPTTY